MYTCYFAKFRNITNPIFTGYAITAFLPTWATRYKHYPYLAPDKNDVLNYKNNTITSEQYTANYLNILNNRKITPNQILKDLGDNAVLLCFEKPGDFCHRHIAAQWLRSGGVQITELT